MMFMDAVFRLPLRSNTCPFGWLASSVFLLAGGFCATPLRAAGVDRVEPFFQAHCTACHGEGGDAEGDVDLTAIRSDADLIRQPELLDKVMRAIDTAAMPPAWTTNSVVHP